MTDTLALEEGRDDLPIFIHSELDDLALTIEAFRVYAHLARRAGKSRLAWPSYNSIGEACFRTSYPKASQETLRRKAIAAVNELVAAGLIEKMVSRKESGEHTTNSYRLTPRRQWGGSVNTLPSVNAPGGSVNTLGSAMALGSVTAPKGTPLEDNPLEGTPKGDPAAAQPAPSKPPAKRKKEKSEVLEEPEKTSNPQTHPILNAYIEALPYKPNDVKAEVRAAKKLAEDGFEPAEVKAAVEYMLTDSFWDGKYLSLHSVAKQLPAIKHKLLNRSASGSGGQHGTGQNGSRKTYEKPPVAQFTKAEWQAFLDDPNREKPPF